LKKTDAAEESPRSTKQTYIATEAKRPERGNDAALLFLLSKFTFANCLENLGEARVWRQALKTDLSLALNQLLAAGFLRSADLVSILPSAFGSSKLKVLAKERGLPVSGTKDVLAKRLVQADADGMAKLVGNANYFTCSEKGLDSVLKFEAGEKERRRLVEQDCLKALQNSQFREASMKVAAYEASKVFKRGFGLDWENYNPSDDVSILSFLFSTLQNV